MYADWNIRIIPSNDKTITSTNSQTAAETRNTPWFQRRVDQSGHTRKNSTPKRHAVTATQYPSRSSRYHVVNCSKGYYNKEVVILATAPE